LGHVFPEDVFDLLPKFLHVFDGVTATEPEIAGVEVQAEGGRVTFIQERFGQGNAARETGPCGAKRTLTP